MPRRLARRAFAQMAAVALLATVAVAPAGFAQGIEDARLKPLPMALPEDEPLTIAVLATEAVGSLHEQAGRVAATFVPAIRQRLEAEGHRVVGPAETAAVLEAMRHRLGGIYDPLTGALNTDKRDHAWQHGLAELAYLYGVDRLLITQVFTVPVQMSGQSVAEWCGVTQSVYPEDDSEKRPGAERGVTGVVDASCMLAELRDASDIVHYRGFGGIEILAYMDGNRSTARAASSLFKEASRNERAVRHALGPLLGEDVAPERRPPRETPRANIRRP